MSMDSKNSKSKSSQHGRGTPEGDRGGRGRRRGGRGGGRGRSAADYVLPPTRPETLAGLKRDFDDSTFIVFDIETTGGNPEKNGITEIFALKVRGTEILSSFYSLVNPGIPIPPIVRRMTGIDNRMVRHAPKIEAVMGPFVEFIGDHVLVSHNTIGDMKFVRYFAQQARGITLDNFYLCTHLLVEKLAPTAPDKSLKGLAEHFDLDRGQLHRAEADAYVTLELFKVLRGRLTERSVTKVEQAIRLQGDMESGLRLGWGVHPESLQRAKPGPGVFFLRDHEGGLLFLSSAVSLDREVAKLAAPNQLPRQLLKLVLRSYDLEVKPSANVFAAMVDEARALGETALPVEPASLHQRQVQTLYLTTDIGASSPAAEGLGWRLDVGAVAKGTRWAVGPIRDRRLAIELVTAVGEIFGRPPGRTGLLLADAEAELVRLLITGQLEQARDSLKRQARSPRLWFRPSERRQLKVRLAWMDGLLGLRRPGKLLPLLDQTGVLVLPDHLSGGWQIHHVIQSLPVALETVGAGVPDAAAPLPGSPVLGRELVERLRSRLAGEAGLTPPQSAEGSLLTNAVLWWLWNRQSEGHFYHVDELEAALGG